MRAYYAFPSYFAHWQCSHRLTIKHILSTFPSPFVGLCGEQHKSGKSPVMPKYVRFQAPDYQSSWSGNCSSAFFVLQLSISRLVRLQTKLAKCHKHRSYLLLECNKTKNILRNYLVISTHQLLFSTQNIVLLLFSATLSLPSLLVMQNEQYSLWLNNRRIKTCFLTTSSNFSPNPYTNSITSFPHSITMEKLRKIGRSAQNGTRLLGFSALIMPSNT